ncbi:MAG: molybdenum cofactor guanylyltransferase [Tissierellia bacterium]|nr:molybdenum cofactor guanylyltransferase [Tissierellia bacterium]
MKKTSAIILTGGKSIRMNYPKEMLSFKGEYLIENIVEKLYDCFEDIIIVTNNKKFHYQRSYSNFSNVKIVSDLYKNKGPIAGLHAGLYNSENEDNFLVACDMPFIKKDFLNYIKSIKYDKILVAKRSGYIEPFFAMYKLNLLDDLIKYIEDGNKSLNGFIKRFDYDLIDCDILNTNDNYRVFENLNYPKNWRKYIKEVYDEDI